MTDEERTEQLRSDFQFQTEGEQIKIDLLIKLNRVYVKYIHALVNEMNDMAGIAIVHGWRSTRVEEGEQIRKEIEELEKKIHPLINLKNV